MNGDLKDNRTLKERLNEFTILFDHDLESWFNASTFYCDNCVDEFIQEWPGIYNWQEEFQRNSIPLDSYFDGGYIQDSFTKDEFFELVKEMGCFNCGSEDFYNIWPFDIPFDVPDHFYHYVTEITQIAEETPFLMLSHPFAKEVYKELNNISKTTNPSKITDSLFRARVYQKGKEYNNDDFLAANKKDIKEGRYNHAGKQVLYLADDASTCFFEMRKPTNGIMLARIKINSDLKILDLLSNDLDDNGIIQAIKHSSLLSSPSEGEGWYKPHYVFTRFVSDVASKAGFEAIRYPSVRFSKGWNIVVLNYEKIKDKVRIIDFKHYNDL